MEARDWLWHVGNCRGRVSLCRWNASRGAGRLSSTSVKSSPAGIARRDRGASALTSDPARLCRTEPAGEGAGQQVPGHQPLNRQSKTKGSRSMSRPWRIGSGPAWWRLAPIIEAIRTHVMSAERIHADDTTGPVLAKLKTVTGRIWTYVCSR